ncbi:MAG: hypothetical protein AAGH92_00730 [Planctomycetota bacterium]
MNPSGFARLGITTALATLIAVGGSVAQPLPEVGFDRDDFLVSNLFGAEGGGVFVLDADLSVKGRLANSTIALATGLDFDHQGRLVARFNPNPGDALVRVIEPDGRPVPEFPPNAFNSNGTLDLKVSPNDTYLAASQNAGFGEPNGLLEFDRFGNLLRTLDTGPDYEGVAFLGDGMIWAGGGSGVGFLNAFDLATGTKTELFGPASVRGTPPDAPPSFDGGQRSATSLHYDATTDTVLIADRLTPRIFEREKDGALLNTFVFPTASVSPDTLLGVTRGPGGEVYAASSDIVYRFAADGTFIDETSLGLGGLLWNIVWAGNAPIFNALPGDFDGDGQVAQGDLNLVLSNWGTNPTQTGTIEGFVITAMLDGLVDQEELNAVLNNWGGTASPDFSGSPIPEPAGLLALGVLGITPRRRACARPRLGAGGLGRSSSSRWSGAA